jgi:hypothetical protein
VSEKVSLDEAVTSLLGLLEDFSFATPADKSRCLAGFISPALKFGRLSKSGLNAPDPTSIRVPVWTFHLRFVNTLA